MSHVTCQNWKNVVKLVGGELSRESRQFNARELLVLASSDVIDLFLDEESESLAELQEFINTPIRFQVESLYTQEQFDVVLL